MTQATLERSAAKRPAGKASAKSTNPREKIIWQLTELQAGIAVMVESEQGDCLGRVLDHAGETVASAAALFAASDSDASSHRMLDANSFIQAAAALAAQEHCDKAKPAARWTEAQRLADLSAAIVTAQDQLLTDIMIGNCTAVSSAAPTPEPQTAPTTAVDGYDATLDLHRVRAVLWMLIRTVGGEIPEQERPATEDIVCCIQFVNRVFSRIGTASNDIVNGDFHTHICDGRGIASALDAMTWSDGMQIVGSDEMMSGLFDALYSCADDALKAITPDTCKTVPELRPRSRTAPDPATV
ncbi:MAG: hypothetical protein V4639_03395 [Pseudomonadota bacterium]